MGTSQQQWLKARTYQHIDVSSYRPISNLPVLSKLLECLVVRQLMDYLQSTDLLPANKSGFRPGHATETAVLRVLSDILLAVDRGDVADPFWIFQLHSTRLIMRFCCSVYRPPTALVTSPTDGSGRTCLAGRNTYELGPRARPSSTSFAVSLKDQSLVRFCSYCTLPAWFPWSKAMV